MIQVSVSSVSAMGGKDGDRLLIQSKSRTFLLLYLMLFEMSMTHIIITVETWTPYMYHNCSIT